MMLLNISCVFLCLAIYKLYNYINLRSMSLQRLHDSAATSGRSDRNDRTIQTHRLHVETGLSAKVRKNRRTSKNSVQKKIHPRPRRSEDVSLWMFTTPYAIVPPMISSSSLVMAC